MGYVKKINIWRNHAAETAELRIGNSTKDIPIYTEGSKLKSGATGSAYKAYKTIKIKTWPVPLKKCNSVFQAVLLTV